MSDQQLQDMYQQCRLCSRSACLSFCTVDIASHSTETPHAFMCAACSTALPQPGKCLYTTIRELVENALDSAESISTLPLVEIIM
jgi:hypothetical protein